MKSLSRVRLFATRWTVAHQASPSMGYSRQEYWSGLPFPSPGDLLDPGIEPRSHVSCTGRWVLYCWRHLDLPGGSDGKASACSAGDPGLIPGLGRSSREGNGNPLQYSRLENPMDRGAWQATVHGVAKSRTRLNDFTFTFFQCHLGSPKRWPKPKLIKA